MTPVEIETRRRIKLSKLKDKSQFRFVKKKDIAYFQPFRAENHDWLCCNCNEVLKRASDGPASFELHEAKACMQRDGTKYIAAGAKILG